jgi:hypothetical protein
MKNSDEDNRVYFDPEKGLLYVVEWVETGNNNIPKKTLSKYSVPTYTRWF